MSRPSSGEYVPLTAEAQRTELRLSVPSQSQGKMPRPGDCREAPVGRLLIFVIGSVLFGLRNLRRPTGPSLRFFLTIFLQLIPCRLPSPGRKTALCGHEAERS